MSYKAALSAAAVSLPLALGASAAQAQDAVAKALSIITTAEAESQTMALVLSNQMQAQGTQVQVLLCGPAGDLALAEAPEASLQITTPRGMSPRSLLEGLMAKGGTVEVCAIYLPNRSLTADALLSGVTAAAPPAIAGTMRDPAVRVFSF